MDKVKEYFTIYSMHIDNLCQFTLFHNKRCGFGSCHSLGVAVGLSGNGKCQKRGRELTRPEKSLQCGGVILPQVYTFFLILNTVYICFGDETDVSNAGEQLAMDKSPGDEVIRFNHAGPDNYWDSAFLLDYFRTPYA
ncbi:MAG: hypothetical protein AABY93_17355 [Bacteroidota bacterium]